MQTAAKSIRTGVLLAGFAATGFAMKGIFIKLAFAHGVDAATLLMQRLMFSIALLWLVRTWRITRLAPHEQEAPIITSDKFKIVGLGLIGYYLANIAS